MASGSLAELIAGFKAAIRRALKGVRAFAGTIRPEAPAKLPAAPAAHFGEQERLEESKYYPPAPSYTLTLEGELPDSYGKTRVVLLVVDSNLVHAYWEVAPDKLQQAKSQMEDSSQAVLRFYEASGCFDVDVDLGPRNWYVPLWSAGKSYYADLGLRGGDGIFVQLARSNVVLTPPALPTVEVGERFMRVASPGGRAEIVPPPPYRKPRWPYAPLQPLETVSPAVPAGDGRSGADLAEVPSSPSAPLRAAAGFATPFDSEEILRAKLAEFYALREWHREPLKPEESPIRGPGGPRPAAGFYATPIDAEEILRRKLAEFYALREWHREPLKPEEEPLRGPGGPWPEELYPDLTELAEKQQTMGLSSALLQSGGKPHGLLLLSQFGQ